MKKLNLFAVSFIIFSAATAQSFADYTVNSTTASTFTLNALNPNLTIESGGNIVISGGGPLGASPAISGSGLSTFQVTANGDFGEGINGAGPAISINDGLLSALNMNSGLITSSASSTISLVDSRSGTNEINISSNNILGNTATSGNTIYYDNTGSNDATLNISNSGFITANNNAGSNAIYLNDSTGGSTLILNNNLSGSISAGVTGQAIRVIGNNAATINNSHTITGGITIDSGATTITNLGAATINGNINLGSNSSSSITNQGAINGNIILGNAAQILTISGGTIDGTIDGSTDDTGILKIGNGVSSFTFTTSSDIGSAGSLASTLVNASATLNLSDNNNSLKSTTVSIASGATLTLGTGSVTGDIKGASDGVGVVNFNESNTLDGAVGTNLLSLSSISIASSAIVAAGTNSIDATDITVNNFATLSSSNYITGAITLGIGTNLSLGDGSYLVGAVDGSAGHRGSINTTGLAIILAPVGATNQISEINVAAGSQARIGNSDSSHADIIRADDINVTGQLDLLNASTITGDLTMIGSSAKINSSGYSQTINGNFTTSSGSQMILGVHTSTSADQIIVSGTANIDSNTKLYVSFSGGGTTASGSSYIIVQGGTGSTINAVSDANISVEGVATNHYGSYILHTSISGDNLLLNVVSATSPGTNSNQNTIYDIITNASAGSSGGLYTMQQYLNGAASDSNKSAALNSTLSQVDNSNNRIIFNSATASLDVVSGRLRSFYGNTAGMASGDIITDKRKSVWGQVFGSNMSQGNTAASDGYNSNLYGFAFGADKEISDNFIAGLSLSYAAANSKSHNSLKQTNINSYQINAYSGYHFDKYFINGLAGFVWNDYKSNRYIPVATSNARANYEGQAYIARAEFGLNQKLQKGFILTPTATFTAANNSISDYSENGAGTLDLRIKNGATNFFETRAGIALSNKFKVKDFIVQPEIFTSYGYDLAGVKQKTNASFVGQTTTFNSAAQGIARGSWKIGAATKIYGNDTLSFNVNYTFEHRAEYQANSVALKGIYKF